MRRKELKKAVRKYAKENRFYRYGLIAKYLKHLDKKEKELYNSIPEVKCPDCGSEDIEIEHSDCEYTSYSWLSCNYCGEDFDDEVGYGDVIDSINCIPWWDSIYNRRSCDEDIDFKSIEWKKYCEDTILEELGR